MEKANIVSRDNIKIMIFRINITFSLFLFHTKRPKDVIVTTPFNTRNVGAESVHGNPYVNISL